ncbi:MAG: DNA replication/repair protein RecF [Thermoanaerobaculia bacterium]
MILQTLHPENFRNLAAETIGFHPGVNVVVGLNGQGKTNLLEAIYFLATTKSFRTPRGSSLFRFDSPSLFASGSVERDGVARTLSVGLESGETKKRVLMINSERVTLSAYVSALNVFAYSASRLEILRGAPEERRRFLDRGIASINPGYLDDLSRYTRVLRQRNALLQSGSESSLAAWDDEFIATAGAVHRARTEYSAAVTNAFQRIVTEHAYHIGNLEIHYRSSAAPAMLREELPRLRRHELRARMSLTGPQRDTIDFLVNGRAAGEVLSGGEQKMIVLFLKFAKVDVFRERRGDTPLFLLDDIDAELDLQILQKLIRRLPSETQVFATSAKEVFLSALEAGPHRRLTIENGRVTASRDF